MVRKTNDIAERYDVIVAGARCAGSATGMLLARAGLRVLVVDPAREGSDTLSTHALMRSATTQLHRWGLLDEIRRSGTPPIRQTTFTYGGHRTTVDIRPKHGVDALVAPRRTVLDLTLARAARRAGAQVEFGCALSDIHFDGSGRVRGATVTSPDRGTIEVACDWVIGADGANSRVARLVGARTLREAQYGSVSIYGYFEDVTVDGYDWYYGDRTASGAIPTNGGTCVFAGFGAEGFLGRRTTEGLDKLYMDTLTDASPELAERLRGSNRRTKLRAFPGSKGFVRESVGPGWVLVGDAGWFRDPITAHGISDALREAELVATRIVEGGREGLAGYQAARDERISGLFEITDRIASYEWSLAEVQELHVALNVEMKALAVTLPTTTLDRAPLRVAS